MADIKVTVSVGANISTAAQLTGVYNQATPQPATINLYNTNSPPDLLDSEQVASGATENISIPATTITTKNTAGTTVAGPTDFPSAVVGEQTLADIALNVNDQDGISLSSTTEKAGVNITKAVTVDKNTVIRFPFDSGTDTSGLVTISSYNAGIYLAANSNTIDDGSSGTISYSINSGSYASFPTSQVLSAGNTVQAKRTVTSAAGYAQIGGIYVL